MPPLPPAGVMAVCGSAKGDRLARQAALLSQANDGALGAQPLSRDVRPPQLML
jgi:hypothetical protein